MKTSESLAQLAPALAKAQGELKAVVKDAKNPHFKNTYASLDTILETIRPTLAKHGLSLVQGATAPHTSEEGFVRSFVVETMLLHASGEFIMNAAVMPLAKADPQGSGGAMTYGRRYGVSALLALATDEDDDGQRASDHVAPTRPAARPTTTPAAAPIADRPEPEPTAGEPSCPTCQGPMWDNRMGKKNPKAPDFKCKDKGCDGVIWPPRQGRGAPAAPMPMPEPVSVGARESAGADFDDLPF